MNDISESYRIERTNLFSRLQHKLEIAENLTRKVVSFQANKAEPFYRLFKYKEGFSSSLVKHFVSEYCQEGGKVLDPFAGAGATLFSARDLGHDSDGIELLPVGIFAIRAREALEKVDFNELSNFIDELWINVKEVKKITAQIQHIPITKDAFPLETETLMNQYLSYAEKIKNPVIGVILKFAAFSVLEEVSYTRKDGQYLRWDYRSARNLSGKPFNKGEIFGFKEAVSKKLQQILTDINPVSTELFPINLQSKDSNINLMHASCLDRLPMLDDNYYDCVVTSPPYCNRYDYTRTYALELVFLGNDNDEVRRLRQEMLSCTVENKEKLEHLREIYRKSDKMSDYLKVIDIYNKSAAMKEVNSILSHFNSIGTLNNSNIERMVRNYFLEMCFVIYELARVIRKDGYCIMVNDNVRYGGEEIPVDLILSDFAENCGFDVKKILVLPKGKGNSSQQMGSYGRTEVRKCVYIWQKI